MYEEIKICHLHHIKDSFVYLSQHTECFLYWFITVLTVHVLITWQDDPFLFIIGYIFIFFRYMKGRMNYTQVNTAIDELNKAFSEKYKVLGMKRTTLNDLNKKRYERYKEQETKDTKGILHLTHCQYICIIYKVYEFYGMTTYWKFSPWWSVLPLATFCSINSNIFYWTIISIIIVMVQMAIHSSSIKLNICLGIWYHLGRHSGDLLLWVGVRRRLSSVVHRALTSSSQELLGQSYQIWYVASVG